MNMEHAIKFIELTNEFVTILLKNHKMVERLDGRRFDRIKCDGKVLYFIDRNSWEIFGAKSSFQYNSRRQFGTLDSAAHWDWKSLTPIAGSQAERIHNEREVEIQNKYRPRGRPRTKTKVVDGIEDEE